MKTKKILIVDDEMDFQFLMSDFLSRKGFEVFYANSIATGIDLLDQERPDILLMDNSLPDGWGWSKTDFILKNYPQTRLILMSGLEVPKTSSLSFHILDKLQIKDQLGTLLAW